jgi:hypothetical protein
MDGSIFPAPVPRTIVPQPIDIEDLLQWAVAYSKPVMTISSERAALFNYGYTALPAACGGSFSGGSIAIPMRRAIDVDADLVLQAVNGLDMWTRSLVLANARRHGRPDWMEGVEPQQVETKGYFRKKGWRRKQHKTSTVMVWLNGIGPAKIRAARDEYSRWHGALTRLVAVLNGQLKSFTIKGFGAPAAPWEPAIKESA